MLFEGIFFLLHNKNRITMLQEYTLNLFIAMTFSENRLQISTINRADEINNDILFEE